MSGHTRCATNAAGATRTARISCRAGSSPALTTTATNTTGAAITVGTAVAGAACTPGTTRTSVKSGASADATYCAITPGTAGATRATRAAGSASAA